MKRLSARTIMVAFPVIAFACAAILMACERPREPVWWVGELGFTATEVEGLTRAQRSSLADLAAFGQARASGRMGELGAPLAERGSRPALVERLGYALAAERDGLDQEWLREAYRADPEWELEVRHVVRLVDEATSPDREAEARSLAGEVARRARGGEEMARLAAEYSEEPGAAERGGLLRPGRRGTWVEPFWEAAVALEPGEVAGPVRTPFGYHVLVVEERRPVSFDEVSTGRVLERTIEQERARVAYREWSTAREGGLSLDPPALARSRELLAAGRAPDTLVLATWPGGRYTALDLAVHRAWLDRERRGWLLDGDDAGFGFRVMDEARLKMHAEAARERGLDPPAAAVRSAERRWEERAVRLAAALGIREGASAGTVRERALSGLDSPDQEARVARAELEILRPLLRRAYPVRSGPEP